MGRVLNGDPFIFKGASTELLEQYSWATTNNEVSNILSLITILTVYLVQNKICKNILQLEPISTFLNLYVPICTYLSLSDPIWIYLNLFGLIWTYLILSEVIIWTYLNLIKPFWAYWNLLNLSEPIQNSSNTNSLSKLILTNLKR